MSNIALPYTQIIDPAAFKSVLNAKIYIGEYGVLPNPANSATWKQAYFVQDDGSRVAASQPIRTNAAGFAVDGSGNIRTVQVDGQYSIIVQDSLSVQKYSNTRVTDLAADLANTADPAKGATLIGYKGRTQADKNADITNIYDVGYVSGDISTFIASAASAGVKRLYFPYRASGFTFSAGITLTGVNDMELDFGKNLLHVGGSAPTAVVTGIPATVFLGLENCSRVRVKNARFETNAFTAQFIGMSGCIDCVIEYNEFVGCSGSASVMTYGNSRCQYQYNTVLNSQASARGLWIGNNNSIEHNSDISFNFVSGNAATGIAANGAGMVVIGNTSVNNAGAGIILTGNNAGGTDPQVNRRQNISNNVCTGNLFHGFQWDAGVTTSTLSTYPSGTDIIGNNFADNTNSGIFLIWAFNAVISGNSINNNGINGISFNGNCYDVSINGNTINNVTATEYTKTQQSGIRIATGSTDVLRNIAITGNVCSRHSAVGINFDVNGTSTLDNVAVIGNVACDNTVQGIKISNAAGASVTNCSVSNNVAIGNATADIRLDVLSVHDVDNVYATRSDNGYWTFTSGDTTPSVQGQRGLFRAANGSATSITNFTNGVPGQTVKLFSTNGNTTIVHGTPIRLKGSTNVTIGTDQYMTFLLKDTYWIETGRSF